MEGGCEVRHGLLVRLSDQDLEAGGVDLNEGVEEVGEVGSRYG